jgi:hypothetical protein
MHRAGVVAVVAICFSSGCALGIQGPPKDYDARRPPACDQGKSGVVGDGVLAATSGLIGLAVMSESPEAGGAALAIGGLLALSAVRGNRAANACRDADRRHVAYLDAQRSMTNPVAPDATPRIALPKPDPLPAPEEPAPRPTLLSTPPAPAAPAPRPQPTDDEVAWRDFWELVP